MGDLNMRTALVYAFKASPIGRFSIYSPVLSSATRLATAMVYLKSAQAGGRTVFPLLSLSVPASPLSLLFWHNLTPDLQVRLGHYHWSR